MRAALLDATVALIAEQGLAKVTVDAVARAAGVTKGGLFHHFASKQDLIDGVLADMLANAEAAIAAAMAADPEPHGRFTRAYLNGVLGKYASDAAAISKTMCVAMLGDPQLQGGWSDFVAGHVARNAETDGNPACALVRLAADGIWLASLTNSERPPPVPDDVRDALIALTYPS